LFALKCVTVQNLLEICRLSAKNPPGVRAEWPGSEPLDP
jgi:hypothetical protein